MTPNPHHPPWRAREREWALIAAATALLCLVFSAWPQLDLEVARAFHGGADGFAGDRLTLVRALYWSVPWLGRAAALAALVLCVTGWRDAGRLGRSRWRRAVVLGLVLLLGVGGLVNGVLKEHWGRARPNEVAELGGQARYVPALRPTDQCAHNCSFVSGHAATGFALIALGCFGAPATRRRWLLRGLALGLLVGAGRVMQGGHFLSDVLFAGLAVWTSLATLRQLWLLLRLRQRRRRSAAPGIVRRPGPRAWTYRTHGSDPPQEETS